jgi:hypothetical protein
MRRRLGIVRTWGLLGLGLLVLTGAPSVAQACAVCTAGRDEENALAFLLSTIGMSLMPLVALGTLVFVLWRRIQKLEMEGRDAESAKTRIEPAAASLRR